MTNTEALEVLKNLIVDYDHMNDDAVAEMDLAIDCALAALEATSPCDLCTYNPPSRYGKPCSCCPAEPCKENENEQT